MKQQIRRLVTDSVQRAIQAEALAEQSLPKIEIEVPKNEIHGDFSTNIAMIMASTQKKAPRKIAEQIIDTLEDHDNLITKTEIAGPGFINFFINIESWQKVLRDIHAAGDDYGRNDMGQGEKFQIEFVSSNPTGPLHVGHGRGAAVGDSVGNILGFCGYDVQKEYYINDAGRQIETLGRSVFLRYQELLGKQIDFPKDCYQGAYIQDIATIIQEKYAQDLDAMPDDTAIAYCARVAAGIIIKGIRQDLEMFGVSFNRWFSEQSLYDSGSVDQVIAELQERNIVYEKDGATWFKTSEYQDEKDRVIVRQNGQKTYFASDVAYHLDKYRRGFEKVIDVWGADHHGYIPRMTASIEALGYRRDQFEVILVQLVNLLRGGEPVAMSTRAGEFITLKDVVNEVGTDAARFLFLTRHYESPLDFDLELAKKKTNENPVYYVQYVHARISSIIKKGKERGVIDHAADQDMALNRLVEPEEIQLIRTLDQFPEVVKKGANFREPHRITYFLMNLASAFHSYYNKHRVLADDPALVQARLSLVMAVRRIIRIGLTLLGVSAPEKM
jgi:arginyl-tRNA synthetase